MTFVLFPTRMNHFFSSVADQFEPPKIFKNSRAPTTKDLDALLRECRSPFAT